MSRPRKPPPPLCEPCTGIPDLDTFELIPLAAFANRYEHANSADARLMLGSAPGFAKQARLIGRYARERVRYLMAVVPEHKTAREAIAEAVYRDISPCYQWRATKPRQLGAITVSVNLSPDGKLTLTSPDHPLPLLEWQCPTVEVSEHMAEYTHTLIRTIGEKLS